MKSIGYENDSNSPFNEYNDGMDNSSLDFTYCYSPREKELKFLTETYGKKLISLQQTIDIAIIKSQQQSIHQEVKQSYSPVEHQQHKVI